MHPRDVNFLLATWAVDLMDGGSILGANLRSATLRQYIDAAIDLLKEAGYKFDPLKDEHNLHYSKVHKELTKFESIPNRRECFTDEIIEEFYKKHKSAKRDSLEDCFYDWLALGRYTGYRRNEWAQSRKLSYEHIDDDPDLLPKAVIDRDILFFNDKGHLLEKIPANERKAFRINVCWRVQKNGQNKEIISFWRDDIDPRWCPVRAAWRIVMRAKRLNIPADQPLGKYLNHNQGRVVFINDTECEKYMRQVAMAVTGITDTATINKMFGMHSIRVTACNELARLGVADSFIQRRLRWRSLAFLTYLRNTVYAAQRHNLSTRVKISPHDTELLNNIKQGVNTHTGGSGSIFSPVAA